MGLERLPPLITSHYEVYEWKHASAILVEDFPNEWQDIIEVLQTFRLRRSWIEVGGKNKSDVSKQIDQEFFTRGWEEKQFSTSIVVDGRQTDSPTHKVDCFKNRVALEIEWNR